MQVSVTLSKLVLESPTLVGSVLSVDVSTVPLIFLADIRAEALEISIRETGQTFTLTTYTATTLGRRFTGEVTLPTALGTYHVDFRARTAPTATQPAVSPDYNLVIIRTTNEDVPQALPPAGVSIHRQADLVKVEWQTPRDAGFLGVRVLVSTDATGVTTPFTQVGQLIQNLERTSLEVLTTSKSILMNGLHRITTQDDELMQVQYSSVVFHKGGVGNADTFYVCLTTLIQDPDTHHVHESFANGPFQCTFVDLRKVSPMDFPGATSPEDFATELVQGMTTLYPELDLGPRTEARDLFVDPISLEFANESVRGWFGRVSSSPSALLAVDDSDGDGVSDDPEVNPYKQSLAKAFRLSGAQVQGMIDKQFEVLGERAGVPRAQKESAVCDVTFYMASRPTQRIEVSLGATATTLPDEVTASVMFTTMGSATIDPLSADSYYIPDLGWGVTIPCVCSTPGSEGNVGAWTIRTVVSGVSGSIQCVNLFAADYGLDLETNHSFASRIANRAEAGVDSGRRLGYLSTAKAVPGVIKAQVVASGDLAMLRDWDYLRERHIYGTVDVYVRGRSFSQDTPTIPYLCETLGTFGMPQTYNTVALSDAKTLKFYFVGSAPLDPVAQVVELFVERQGSDSAQNFYLGVERMLYDATTKTLWLHGDDRSYTYKSGERVLGSNNREIVAALNTSLTLWALCRTWSALVVEPKHQPVTKVSSIAGNPTQTGVIPLSAIRLLKTSDPLLEGGSTQAGDKVRVDNIATAQVLTAQFKLDTDTLDLGEGVCISVDSLGVHKGITAITSEDGHTLYSHGIAYATYPVGAYGRLVVKRLAGDASVTGGQIPLNTNVRIAYDSWRFRERITLHTETVKVTGNLFTSLARGGVSQAYWVAQSHGLTTLTQDADLMAAQVPYVNRWLKVKTSNGNLVRLDVDFIVNYDADTDRVQIARKFGSSAIGDGEVLTVSYHAAEVFTATTSYPQFLNVIAEQLEASRHAAADVVVKTMQASLVDIDFTVELAAHITPDVIDRKIRTVVTAAFDTATTALTQSELVRLIKALPGVANVQLPFRRMTKADGAYDIGLVIPTTTLWESATSPTSTWTQSNPTWTHPLSTASIPRVWITQRPVLRYATLASGGYADSYVGLLYEGESYKRCLTMEAFKTATDAAFYILGAGDDVSLTHYGKILMITPTPTALRPQPLRNPNERAYRVTYQVFGESGAQDIPIGPTEYLRPGRISVDYVQQGV